VERRRKPREGGLQPLTTPCLAVARLERRQVNTLLKNMPRESYDPWEASIQKDMASREIDEGEDLITEELDEHGNPIVFKPEDYPKLKPVRTPVEKEKRKRKAKGLCAACGHDPCLPDCLYR